MRRYQLAVVRHSRFIVFRAEPCCGPGSSDAPEICWPAVCWFECGRIERHCEARREFSKE